MRLKAAYRLIDAAWNLWLEFDVRTDDISAVVSKGQGMMPMVFKGQGLNGYCFDGSGPECVRPVLFCAVCVICHIFGAGL